MGPSSSVVQVKSYCAQCSSACPIICTVDYGKLIKIGRDHDHPNSTALCPKGLAGPELVYSPHRLRYPMKRTRPKGDPDPGWERITWDEAMETTAKKLMDIKKNHGAHTVVFNRPGPGGSPSRDYAPWVVRLANAFGSPNTLATGHVCQWHRDTGSKYTYGWDKLPEADYENTELILIWGHNPYVSSRCNARDINAAKRRGAKLVVVDTRRTKIAKMADLWLQIRPGTDGALILGLINDLIEQKRFDEAFVKAWTNGPFLVRSDTGELLALSDMGRRMDYHGYLVWNTRTNTMVAFDPLRGAYETEGVDPAIFGSFETQLANGRQVGLRTVFDLLRERVSPFTKEKLESLTGISSQKIKQLGDFLGLIHPACYYSYNGIEQHTNAMAINRALCVLYAMTGNLDKPGGNVIFPSLPGPKIQDAKLLGPEIHKLRMAHDERPLGPAGNPNSSAQAYRFFDSLLTGNPYTPRALIGFGGNIITANRHSLSGRDALKKLEFYVQTDLFMTPSAELADIVLPAATFYEWPYVKKGFPNLLKARRWVQYRPRVITPQHESKSDIDIILDLAGRLGLSEKFWGGEPDTAFNEQLKPLNLTLEELRKRPGGVSIDLPMKYEKYAAIDNKKGSTSGFDTPSRRVEIFSEVFQEQGYDPLPAYIEPAVSPVSKSDWHKTYPLILTCSKLFHFCHSQHRALPSLRRAVPHPFVEIHPETAEALNIHEGEWVYVETPFGKIKLLARPTEDIAVGVVCTQHGWWQSCPELGLPGYDPYSSDGANANLLYSTEYIDEITGSVPYKAFLCRITKAS